ncbi:MAG: cation:proton antiporter [Acidobacteria bacterium]|nr:cation:proton antiporter [Acidobacteriota bacterium]
MPSFKLLIAQIAVILVVARLTGWLFGKLHQPRVIGEMVAGILLGPSLLGWTAPSVFNALFPPDKLGALNLLSQIGLLLFMFLVGLELDWKQLRELGRAAIITSQVSILAPFLLGFLLAAYLYPKVSDPRVSFTGFALFMSIAMSITAFPVLARILTERNLLRSKVGVLAVTCAAVNDVTAWCALACLVLIVRATASPVSLWVTLVGLGALLLAMLFVVKPALQRLVAQHEKRGYLTHDHLALILLLTLASGWVTESLGLHALFGGFLTGVVMPMNHSFVQEIWQRLESLTMVMLLPLYFAFTGLRSSFLLISGAGMWVYCALIIAVAVIGKFGGSLLAAKFGGLPWREAAAVGVLMNTRGLVELIILNVGLDLGVLSPALFSAMVLMALVTTFMTSPLLRWIYPDWLAKPETIGPR